MSARKEGQRRQGPQAPRTSTTVGQDGKCNRQVEDTPVNAAEALAAFSPLLAHLSGALAAIGRAARTGDLELLRSGVRDLRDACIATELAVQKASRICTCGR